MISVILAILALLCGYLFYSKLVDKIFGTDDRETPANRLNDGIDYVPMPTWKVFLIQLLNIAGTGPIFGALSGAVFGPIVYLWIVFGCIFAGGVHDFMTGMISMRNDGQNISELSGKYLGVGMKYVMRIFSVILLVMCGVVFTTGPAGLLNQLTQGKVPTIVFTIIIIIYYFIATFVPIDKIIGRIYPLFGICLIVMAVGVLGSLMFSGNFVMPELWDNFCNNNANGTHVWPFLFITVACGAISGFHATQSPIMARCVKNEHLGRKIFYGAMISEGVIALVWAAAGVTVYENSAALIAAGGGCSAVVYQICNSTMGKIGSVFAILGVVACPISSGDTAYRSARLTLADWFKFDQKPIINRLILTVPLLAAGTLICRMDYNIVWRYFSWSNQTLATISLWAASIYLIKRPNRKYKYDWLITVIPAAFMNAVTATYFIAAPECLGQIWIALGYSYDAYYNIAVVAGLLVSAFFTTSFFNAYNRNRKSKETSESAA